jgi:hypothetical protein
MVHCTCGYRVDAAWLRRATAQPAPAATDQEDAAALKHFNELQDDCKRHAEFSDDPDMEIGDLQDLLHACWQVMTAEERHAVYEKMRRVECSLCGGLAFASSAHVHQGRYIGDECCWEERLRSSE